jgi:ABC-type Fe3+/spermidine/putrescine transport system ATPase subunit
VGERPTLLSLRSLRKVFESLIAVDDFTLEVAEGEFVTLLGPSGCGKTTLLRMIAGFGRPTAGAILLDGVDITRLPPERRPFNMVFQTYALFPHMNVFDNVAYGLRTAKVNENVVRERVLDGLKLVGLEAKATVGVRALSGGQQQRVALVRAIVNEPRLLLLDEPLGALDLKLRKRMQDELRAIQRRIQTTFLYVTHDQEEALVMSHRIVLMREGRVVQVGAPADVYHRPFVRSICI